MALQIVLQLGQLRRDVRASCAQQRDNLQNDDDCRDQQQDDEIQ
jgi:hypothetical protein